MTEQEFVRRLEEISDELLRAKERIKELEARVLFLDALEQAGVDNWEGYACAQDILDTLD